MARFFIRKIKKKKNQFTRVGTRRDCANTTETITLIFCENPYREIGVSRRETSQKRNGKSEIPDRRPADVETADPTQTVRARATNEMRSGTRANALRPSGQ